MPRMLLLFSLFSLPVWAQDTPADSSAAGDTVADRAAAIESGDPVDVDQVATVNADRIDAVEARTAAIVAQAPQSPGVKTMSGMSILGNEEAPKSLVIVPWKSSRLGDGVGVAHALDQTPRAVDREVFMRELHYYELRSGGGD